MKLPSTRLAVILTLALAAASPLLAKDLGLLNVSCDPTREFYNEYNLAFAHRWEGKQDDTATIQRSHGGWAKAQKTHFGDGGVFDQLYKP
jgi:sulfate transport system substrate-binding protein